MAISPGEGVGGNLPRVADPPREPGSGVTSVHTRLAEATSRAQSAREVGVRFPSPVYVNNPLPAPCRLCGGPTWLADDEGSIHPCCELSRGQGAVVDAEGLLVCPACKASEVINREWRRRHAM